MQGVYAGRDQDKKGVHIYINVCRELHSKRYLSVSIDEEVKHAITICNRLNGGQGQNKTRLEHNFFEYNAISPKSATLNIN